MAKGVLNYRQKRKQIFDDASDAITMAERPDAPVMSRINSIQAATYQREHGGTEADAYAALTTRVLAGHAAETTIQEE
jgi:hypothetical protein